MRRLPSKSSKISALGVAALFALTPARAHAQACCAPTSAVTPGRLALHEDALVGIQLRGASLFGAYSAGGHYAAAPTGTSEQDFEQDLFVAVRFLRRGQFALVVPLIETRRVTLARGESRSELGGGFGDANVSGRYDVLLAGHYRYAPGIALLAGATLPTGVAPEAANNPLATDATGIGALQLHAGLALEKTFGPWLVSAAGLVAQRLSRSVHDIDVTLAAQWSVVLAGAYTFGNAAGIALSASYATEGNATIDGSEQERTGRRLVTVTASGALPLSDHLRMHGGVFFTPPVSLVGKNQNASAGLSLASVYTFW